MDDWSAMIQLIVILGGIIGIIFYSIKLIRKINSPEWQQKRRYRLVAKNKNFEDIHFFREELTGTNRDFPISQEEINHFLEKAKSNQASALLGIEAIRLEDRPADFSMTIYGSYMKYDSFISKNGSTIRIYPLEKEGDHYKSYFHSQIKEIVDRGQPNPTRSSPYYILLSEAEAKQEMLHTLSHEIAHSVIYNLEEKMHGGNIEQLCDLWAEQLGAPSVIEDKNLYNTRHIYHDGTPVGYIADLKKKMKESVHSEVS